MDRQQDVIRRITAHVEAGMRDPYTKWPFIALSIYVALLLGMMSLIMVLK